MLYSEKIKLLLSGVKMDDIKSLEAEEAKEAEEEAARKAAEEAARKAAEEAGEESGNDEETKTAVELVKELEEKLKNKEDELTKLNAQLLALNNKRTVAGAPPKKATTVDVFKELYGKKEEN